MIRKNYHTHTFRCGHAIGNDEDYILEAIGLGLQTLGFSDHIMLEHVHQPNVRGDFVLSEGYFKSIRRLKQKYRERINVLLGYEAEAFEEYFDYYRKLKEEKIVDYLVLGNHCTIDNGMIRPFFSMFTTKDDVIEYTDTLIKGIETGLFSIVAHPDYFMDTYYEWDKVAIECSKKIITACMENDIPLEFNLACIRRGKVKKGKEIRYGYPYIPFWELVKKMGAKVIIGIDAHAPSDITTYLNDEGYKLAQTLGLNLVDEIKL